jgi:hypothetical protein
LPSIVNGMDQPAPAGNEGPLAEFAALRQEIESRESRRQSLLNLHITASGAVFGYALSAPGNVHFLLVLPVSTYLFCARYVTHSGFVYEIGRYIREELSDRVPGGLLWEAWHRDQPRLVRIPRFLYPTIVAFPLVTLVALVAAIPSVFSGWTGPSLYSNLGILLIWGFGVFLLFLTFSLADSTDQRWRRTEKSI